MEPHDPFGNAIRPYIFRILQSSAQKLEAYGYTELPHRPNLFSRRCPGITFYMDFRGTKEMPIWRMPVAAFFSKVDRRPEPVAEFQYRAMLIEAQRLHDVELRLHFYFKERLGGTPFGWRLRELFEAREAALFRRYSTFVRSRR